MMVARKKEKNGTDPMHGIQQVPYERHLVSFVDTLIDFARKSGSKDIVKTAKDWEVIDFILRGWATLYPKTAQDFYKSMADLRRNQKNALGTARDKGGAEIQHKLELPVQLYQMIEAIFPLQQWDKKFVNKFVKRYPALGAADKL